MQIILDKEDCKQVLQLAVNSILNLPEANLEDFEVTGTRSKDGISLLLHVDIDSNQEPKKVKIPQETSEDEDLEQEETIKTESKTSPSLPTLTNPDQLTYNNILSLLADNANNKNGVTLQKLVSDASPQLIAHLITNACYVEWFHANKNSLNEDSPLEEEIKDLEAISKDTDEPVTVEPKPKPKPEPEPEPEPVTVEPVQKEKGKKRGRPPKKDKEAEAVEVIKAKENNQAESENNTESTIEKATEDDKTESKSLFQENPQQPHTSNPLATGTKKLFSN